MHHRVWIRCCWEKNYGAELVPPLNRIQETYHLAAGRGHGDVVALLERALEKESTSRIRGNANEDHQP